MPVNNRLLSNFVLEKFSVTFDTIGAFILLISLIYKKEEQKNDIKKMYALSILLAFMSVLMQQSTLEKYSNRLNILFFYRFLWSLVDKSTKYLKELVYHNVTYLKNILRRRYR